MNLKTKSAVSQIIFAAVGLASMVMSIGACAKDPPGVSDAATAGSGGTMGGGGSDGGTGAPADLGTFDGGAGWTGMPPVTTLPRLHVDGNLIKDPTGRTIVLRGVSLLDVGTLYAWANGLGGIKARIDTLGTAGVLGHVLRIPVYPRNCVNQSWPYYSPAPFPVGSFAPVDAGLTYTAQDLAPADYITQILQPTIDYATTKGLYVIIDYHQIDDTSGSTAKDATAFWAYVAPLFKDYPNVIYEAFNEPIDLAGGSSAARWATYKARAQTWVDTIRAAAPENLIVVGSPTWDQNVAPTAMAVVTGTNLVFSAHIYPGNWSAGFKAEFATAVAAHPVFLTEWGFSPTATDMNLKGTTEWGADLRATIDGSGASWTAWVADDQWAPPLFSSVATGTLSEFGTLVKTWLQDKATSDWVE